jgi:hypothetical protein
MIRSDCGAKGTTDEKGTGNGSVLCGEQRSKTEREEEISTRHARSGVKASCLRPVHREGKNRLIIY